MFVLLKACLFLVTLRKVTLSEATDEAVFRKHVAKYLADNVFRTEKAQSDLECRLYCLRYRSCLSVNYKFAGIHKGTCELNSKNAKDLLSKENMNYPEYVHLEKVWLKEEKAISADASKIAAFQSCKELFLQERSLLDAVYTLQKNSSSPPYDVFCHMTDISGCGSGGWTLVLKVDGNKNTFTYSSSLWTNKVTYAIQDGLEGMAEKESKLASYWNTPFTKICLGMSYNGDRKWMTFNYTANSLYDVMADGHFRATTAGRTAWKSLIAGSSLQRNCNKEGFNLPRILNNKMRIGIVANEQNDCDSCDSWLGYGTGFNGKTCGNVAFHSPDNGNKDLATFGYILVQ